MRTVRRWLRSAGGLTTSAGIGRALAAKAGAAMVEYALILMLVGLAAVGGLILVGDGVQGGFEEVSSALPGDQCDRPKDCGSKPGNPDPGNPPSDPKPPGNPDPGKPGPKPPKP